MKIKEVLCALEQFAPLPLQEDWDNAGLQVGLTEADVSGALLCLDVNENIIDEAVRKQCNLVVAHHPLLFKGLKTISDADYVQRTVMKAIMNKVVVVAMHTNMDNAKGGVNYKIAEKLKLQDVKFFATMQRAGTEAGSGVIGQLEKEMTAVELMDELKSVFHTSVVKGNELLKRPIRKVAICGGAGDFLLQQAIDEGADAFITGEMHYHVCFGHEQQLQIAVIGHYESEQFTAEIFRDIISNAWPQLPIFIAETNTNPVNNY